MNRFLDQVALINDKVNGFVWGPPMLYSLYSPAFSFLAALAFSNLYTLTFGWIKPY